MMSLKQWYEFNQNVCLQGNAIVTILKNGCRKSEDRMLNETLMRIKDAVALFGDLELVSFSVSGIPHETLNTYYTIKFVLWAEGS